jgi:hypothetical protein
MYVYVCMYMYVCMYVCTYVHIYIYGERVHNGKDSIKVKDP